MQIWRVECDHAEFAAGHTSTINSTEAVPNAGPRSKLRTSRKATGHGMAGTAIDAERECALAVPYMYLHDNPAAS